MRHELALQVAHLLAQYLIYRPEWIAAWSNGNTITLPNASTAAAQDLQWQAALWQKIVSEAGGTQALPTSGKLLHMPDASVHLGETAHLFCLPDIAPLYIEMLNHLAQTRDLHLYLLNPCREYWFDIVDPRRLGYLKARGQADYHEAGNRLLASWGKQGKAMIELLFEKASPSCSEQSFFVSNAERGRLSLLAQVQDAILNLAELQPDSVKLRDDDHSIEIHVCHSLTRELEVLQDQLLALFSSDNTLKPDEVLVVTPDLEHAAAMIDVVFGTVQDLRRIPYTIAGRKGSRINPLAAGLLDLLSIASSRFAASAVFNLLQQPVIARRFGLGETDLEVIHDWMAESGIRWGLNAAHRQQLGLPLSEHYSFNDGMHRLFLAYASPSGSETPFGQRLPACNPEGSSATALGSFWRFMQQLADLQNTLREPKTPDEWQQTLQMLLAAFMSPEGNEQDDLRDVLRRTRELCGNMLSGCGNCPISLDVMQSALTASLDDSAHAGVPTGMVTFTSMGSLRNLPYRIVCAIGLNDSSFPAWKRPVEFDLMEQDHRPGDRQRRDDERNLFLDLLLAARERLYLSYTGHSVRDNSPMPPSVLIADLLDYLTEAIAAPDAHQRLSIEHPLQPFSLACFQSDGDPRILSSNREYQSALKEKLGNPVTMPEPTEANTQNDEDEGSINDETALPFFKEPLAPPDNEWRNVALDQLLRFFRNPCRYLLQQRLGVTFSDQPDDLLDDEPFLPDWDERNSLADRLLPLYLAGANPEAIRASAAAGTEYPPGELGRALLERELRALNAFAEEWQQNTTVPPLPPVSQALEFTIENESWHLVGTFSDLRPDGLIRCRFDDVRATDYLAGWIHHLFLNAIAPERVKPQTIWYSRNGQYTLNPVDNASEHLQQLLALYRQGLSAPLHFFPKAAWAYAKTGDLGKAGSQWRSWNEKFSEGNHPTYRLALRGVENPLDGDFEACATIVFKPLLAHIDDQRLEN